MTKRPFRLRPDPLNPLSERTLLSPGSLVGWAGFDIGWVEAASSTSARSDNYAPVCLAMLDEGYARADFRYGQRSRTYDLKPGSLGLFTHDSHPDQCHWRCDGVRRILLAYDHRHLDDPVLADKVKRHPLQLEIEFYDNALASMLRAMVREISVGCPNGSLFAESLSLGVVMHLHQRTAGEQTFMRERGKLTPAQSRRVLAHIEAHLRHDLSVVELAHAAGFSRTQFSRLFKNTFDCTPYQFVLSARLRRARDLLAGSGLSLAEVAQETGFSSQSHLSSTLQRSDGVTPGSLRRQHRQLS